MRRVAALVWLVFILAVIVNLGFQVQNAVPLSFDLMALLPQDERDPDFQRASDKVAGTIARRALLLVGHEQRVKARSAAERLSGDFVRRGIAVPISATARKAALENITKVYYPYRRGLLSTADRERLLQGRGEEIVKRAVAQIYGFVGFGDAALLRGDPFLLLPAFLADLPVSFSRLALDEGMMAVRDGGKTWVLVALQLNGEPYAVDIQKRLVSRMDLTLAELRRDDPELVALRLGAVFFAHAGAQSAMDETEVIAAIAFTCTVVLILVFFRSFGPLWQSLLVICVGVLCALSLSLSIFGKLHIAALLFGVSLIGTTIDYCVHYFCEIFAARSSDSWRRLRHVLPGLSLGLSTTLIGYLTFLLAPLPGLHQIAVFSAVGMLGSFITVVLWLPFLDRRNSGESGTRLLGVVDGIWAFWEMRQLRRWRGVLFFLLIIAGAVGLLRISANDDIRSMQSLSPNLADEQKAIQRLMGSDRSLQYFLVRAADDETALVREEALIRQLRRLQADGVLAGFQASAQFVPSAARQRENDKLIGGRLNSPWLAGHLDQLGLLPSEVLSGTRQDVLTPGLVRAAIPFLDNLILSSDQGDTAHVVLLDGKMHLERLRDAGATVEGVRFVDPPADVSRLLGKYRLRAVALIALSAVIMILVLAWRYGLRGSAIVMTPPLAAVVLTPGLMALGGGEFTFFDAMALVLVLAVGVDYAVFCAEASGGRKRVTMLAVLIASMTTLLSFGLLVFSGVFAVHAFGSTMLLGVGLAFMFAPFANRASRMIGDSSELFSENDRLRQPVC